MNPENTARPSSTPSTDEVLVRSVSVIAGVVVGLTFIFGFGNVWTLALRLGVPVWVAPLVAPAVDLSILGLLLGTCYLALHGATPEQLRPARRLLIFASLATLALNIADPIVTVDYGKAAFDSVGPLLLIGWAEVGPGLLQAIAATRRQPSAENDSEPAGVGTVNAATDVVLATGPRHSETRTGAATDRLVRVGADGDLVERARQEDAHHWATSGRSRPRRCARTCGSGRRVPECWCRSSDRAGRQSPPAPDRRRISQSRPDQDTRCDARGRWSSERSAWPRC
jgi:hypothetical protein